MSETPLHPLSEKCAMGVEGLDDVLRGGLPRNRLYLVQGDPGVGKTTLALQFLLAGAREGEVCLYITLSETSTELVQVAESHGWDLNSIQLLELSGIDEQLKTETESTFFHPSEVQLNRTTGILLDAIDRLRPSRVVFDSLSEMRLLAETPLRYRRQILQMKQFFAGRNCTVLFLDDRTASTQDLHVESIAHGVLVLQKTMPEYGISRRQLHVQKIRGLQFLDGHHDFLLKKGGMVVFPRLVASQHRVDFETGLLTSGIEELDALLGGGLDRGTSTMFMGPPGTGKSTLGLKFATMAAKSGKKVLFFTFDETIHNLTSRASKLGMDLTDFIQDGTMCVEQIDPAEISPGEFASRIRNAVARDNVQVVVIDSINGYLNAMPAERYLNLQLHELLSYLNQQGVATIMILAQQGLIGTMYSAVDLTYLADTVLLLRFFEAAGEVRQAISVIKKRTGSHERTIREFRWDKSGLRVGPALTQMHGVLTGTPTILNDGPELLPERL
jgi:circadian clock protein KaiC